MGSKVKFLPRPLRRWVRRLWDLPTRLREWPAQRRWLGPHAARRLAWSAFRHPIGDPTDPPGPLDSLTLPGIEHPFWFRHGTSDVQAIRQLFVRREYDWIDVPGEVRSILDVGANIGAASVYLLHRFPQARVVAVEPAPGNLDVLRRNLAPYGERALVVQAAVWPTEITLHLERGYRDGLDWSLQVLPQGQGERVDAITMPTLLHRTGIDRVDLLKIDIEGAERELFRGDTRWLDYVHNLCIELHDAECRAAFDAALRGYDCERETLGETTYCRHLTPINS